MSFVILNAGDLFFLFIEGEPAGSFSLLSNAKSAAHLHSVPVPLRWEARAVSWHASF